MKQNKNRNNRISLKLPQRFIWRQKPLPKGPKGSKTMLLWDSQPRRRVVLRQHLQTEAHWRVIVHLPAMRLNNNQTRWYRGRSRGCQRDSCSQTREGKSDCYSSNTHGKPKTWYREILTHTACENREQELRGWYQKEKGLGKIQIRSQKEVVHMGRLFSQKYFQLYWIINDIANYALSPGFSGSALIPIGDISLFLIWPFKMDVTYSMISVNTGGIREKDRRNLVINYLRHWIRISSFCRRHM